MAHTMVCPSLSLTHTEKHHKTQENWRTSLDIPAEDFGTNGFKYYGEYLQDVCLYLKSYISNLWINPFYNSSLLLWPEFI